MSHKHMQLPPDVVVDIFLSDAFKLLRTGRHETIREHMISLSKIFPSLYPRIKTEVNAEPHRLNNFLEAYGTLPITTKEEGLTYNLPISICLPENYPLSPPSVMLVPTKHMVFKTRHPCVDPSASVTIPYLQTWKKKTSNLVDLCLNLAQVFGADPPLYSRDPLPPPLGLDNRSQFCPLSSAPPLRMPRQLDFESFLTNNVVPEFLHCLAADILKMGVGEEADKAKVSGVITTFRRHVNHIWQEIMKRESSKPTQQELFNLQLQWHKMADLPAESVLVSLDAAIRRGSIPLHLYLSTVRVVSREQFFHRARVLQITNKLNQAPAS